MQIKKWNVYFADLNPAFGTEPGKIRPVVVIQTNFLNDAGYPSTLICPTTRRILSKKNILRVNLKKGEANLRAPSEVLIDQIRTIDNRRFKHKIGELSREIRIEIREKIRLILDLD